MDDSTLLAFVSRSIRSGEMQRTAGSLVRAAADSGGPEAEYRPRFVISTEGPATDRFIVRQFWDFSRGVEGGPGVPVLWNHNSDRLLGQMADLAVEGTPGAGARALGTVTFDGEPEPQMRMRQVQRGMLRACSVGWIPGARVRRGSLAESDPLFLPMEDDECGDAAEGYVLGTEAEPNHLVELSLTPTPADPGAVALGRHAEAMRQIGPLVTGERRDLGAVLLALRSTPSIGHFLARALLSEADTDPAFRAELRRLLLSDSVPTPSQSLADWFRS